MQIEVRRCEYAEVLALRDLYRAEAKCQVIKDSYAGRGFSNLYLMLADGRVAGYAAVAHQHYPGHLNEFYVLPAARQHARLLCLEALGASKATHIFAQTNLPMLLTMLYEFCQGIRAQNYLFHDGITTHLPSPGGKLRRKAEGGWVIETGGRGGGEAMASGGVLDHYNPPYGDIYMDVAEPHRRKGYGSFLVQELKRIAYECGRLPAARCEADNIASRRTLEKAGMLVCGRVLVGRVNQSLVAGGG